MAREDDYILIHDDRLISAALVAEFDRLYRQGLVFLATGESAIISRDAIREIDRSNWK